MWGVGSQCARYKQQRVWNSDRCVRHYIATSQLQQHHLPLYVDPYRGAHKIFIQELPPRRTFIQAPTQRIFKMRMQGTLVEDFNRISTRSSHKDLRQIMRTPSGFHQDLLHKSRQRPLKAFGYDLHKIVAQGIVQDLEQDLHARTPKRIPQDHHTRTCRCWSGPCKIMIPEPPKQEHLQIPHARTSSREFRQDLHKIFC